MIVILKPLLAEGSPAMLQAEMLQLGSHENPAAMG